MAASQNNSSVVNLKPTAGSLATTTDHTIQITKASNSAGIEIQRLRVATRLPVDSQYLASSTFQPLIALMIVLVVVGLVCSLAHSHCTSAPARRYHHQVAARHTT